MNRNAHHITSHADDFHMFSLIFWGWTGFSAGGFLHDHFQYRRFVVLGLAFFWMISFSKQ
jgi:hypothetical protein